MNRRRFLTRGFALSAGGVFVPQLLRAQLSDPAFVAGLTQPQGATGFTYYASNFDGSNDYLTRGGDLTSNADSKKGTVSVWFKLLGGDGASQFFVAAANSRFVFYRNTNNKVYCIAQNSSATTLLNIYSTLTTVLAGSGWHHAMASYDLGTAGARHLYLDGVDRLSVTTFTDGTIDYTQTNHAVGADPSGTAKLNGELCEVYANFSDYLDLSVEANRLKFRSSGGLPVDLGADGSTPTGNQPIIYLRNPYSTFQNNLGYGGNYSVNGALTEGTPPV